MARSTAPLLALLFVLAPAVSAQIPSTTLRGIVSDTTGSPIANAEVSLGQGTQTVRTDAMGRYRIEEVPAGAQWVFVRRLGFAPTRRTVRAKRDAVTPLDFTMVPSTLTLADYVVESVEDWRRARASVAGIFLTHDDLTAGNRTEVSETVRFYLPNGIFSDGRRDAFERARGQSLTLIRAGGPLRCAPAVSFNGDRPREGFPVDAFPVDAVEAVEVYRAGQSRVPWEFADNGRAMACGTVVVWLKS
jgi:hypothetical protein